MDPFPHREAGITQIAESDGAMQQLNEELQEIVEGSAFRGSDRCRQFLQYVVRQAVAGNLNSLKERVIGVEVFGRSPNYNSSEDAIVRVTASDVRKRLQQHYLKNDATDFRINLPIGSYVPEIIATSELMAKHSASSKPIQTAPPPFQGVDEAPKPSSPAQGSTDTSAIAVPSAANSETAFSKNRTWPRQRSLLLVLAVLAALSIPLNFVLWSTSRKDSSGAKAPALSVLPWSAFFRSRNLTHIIVSDPTVVMIQRVTRNRISLSDFVNQQYIPERSSLSPESKEILLDALQQDWTPPGDVESAVSFAELAQSASRTVSVQPAVKTRATDFKTDDNFILLGSPRSNPWVLLFNDRLDFQFFTPPGTQNEVIRDIHPRQNEQSIYVPTTGTAGESYAVVAFVQNPDQDGQVLVLAGATGQGTVVAGKFITDLPRLSEALQNCGISSSGPVKHFEFLLRVSVMAGSSRGFDVAACHILPGNSAQ
jgi:hypothetical protein